MNRADRHRNEIVNAEDRCLAPDEPVAVGGWQERVRIRKGVDAHGPYVEYEGRGIPRARCRPGDEPTVTFVVLDHEGN